MTVAVDTRDWLPGAYVIVVTASVGEQRLRHAHWITLRPPALSRSRLTLVASTATWVAYNGWGGSSHYHGIDGPGGDQFSPLLSYRRPFQAGTVWLPAGAPRCPNPPREPGSHVYYDAIDWAFSHAYGKHYASAGWATYERHFVRWAEANGYGVDVITQHDLHFRPEILSDAGPLVFVGHDEYWTWEMRRHLDAFIDGGGQVARLAGNFMWQIRLAADGSDQTCYKGRAAHRGSRPRRPRAVTTDSRPPGTPLPSATREPRRSAAQALAASTSPWAGSRRAAPAASPSTGPTTGYLPAPTPTTATCSARKAESLPTSSTVLTTSSRTASRVPQALTASTLTPSRSSASASRRTANATTPSTTPSSTWATKTPATSQTMRYGEITPETLDKVARGCGVIAEYHRGRGRVLSAASCEWVNGLRLRDPEVEQVTRNILDALLSASA